MGTELPVLCLLWGAGWEAMSEVCLEPPPPTPWTHGAELACQVGHSAPGPPSLIFQNVPQSISQAIKNTL